MKSLFTLSLLILVALFNTANAQNLTQGSIVKSNATTITVYAKATANVPIGTNVLVLFAVSLPGNTSITSLAGASSIGGTIAPQPFETLGGRRVFPFSLEAPSSTAAISNSSQGSPIATVTFNGPNTDIQLNDYSGVGANQNGYWYVSYAGSDGTNYNQMFFGLNATNGYPNNSSVTASLPLPVTLVAFNANKFQDRSSHLTWTTASETNSSHFMVQSSTDKKSWKNLGTVKAAGESQLIQNYEFFDYNVYNGRDSRLNVFYRLQMVDLDGQQKNSTVESVVFGTGIAPGREFVVYPNPASDGVQVEWDANRIDQPTQLEFFDVSGKLVYSEKVTENTNQQYIDFGKTDIQPGLYLLRILKGIEPIEFKQIVVGQR